MEGWVPEGAGLEGGALVGWFLRRGETGRVKEGYRGGVEGGE